MSKRKKAWLSAGACAVVGTAAWIAFAPQAPGQSGAGPQYAPNHDLLLPVGFESWMFVGSNLGLGYKTETSGMTPLEAKRADAPKFHNIYLSPEAYAQFAATKTFPDRTVLVMEIFAAADKDTKGGVLSTGYYDGDRVGLMAAVKNFHRPDGSTTPWAYYTFTDDKDPSKLLPTAPAHPDNECENCHKLHASTDHVWVQFYPVLRKLLQ
jgi:hypothetical protein